MKIKILNSKFNSRVLREQNEDDKPFMTNEEMSAKEFVDFIEKFRKENSKAFVVMNVNARGVPINEWDNTIWIQPGYKVGVLHEDEDVIRFGRESFSGDELVFYYDRQYGFVFIFGAPITIIEAFKSDKNDNLYLDIDVQVFASLVPARWL